MKVKNKRTVDNFEPSVLKNMILLSLSSNKDKFKFFHKNTHSLFIL